MEKQITIITLGILMLTGALAMYAGESMTFEINITEPVYMVVGNSSNLDGLTIEFENGNITISSVLNYKPDNFTIIFFDNSTREVIETIYERGHTKTKYVDRNATVYVPEYIDVIKEVEVPVEIEVEVEKIVDNTIIIEKDSRWWQITIATVAAFSLGWFIFRKKRINKKEEANEEIMELVKSARSSK
jgi:hypothetical protein